MNQLPANTCASYTPDNSGDLIFQMSLLRDETHLLLQILLH